MHPLQNRSRRGPSLPQEIIDFIIRQIPLNNIILASLALCSKSFYSIYNVLLYRDIYLYTPTQLIQLYDSEQSKSKLYIVHALHIDESILHDETWVNVRTTFDPVHYLVTILRATTSLRWLHVVHSKFGVTNTCDQEPLPPIRAELGKQLELLLNEQREAFLPNLHIFSDGGSRKPFNLLFGRRPLMLWSTFHHGNLGVYIFGYNVNVNLSGNTMANPGYQEARSRTLSSHPGIISAADVGYFVRDLIQAESTSSLAIATTMLQIHISPRETLNVPPSIVTSLPWIQSMLAALAEPQLRCLHVHFGEAALEMPLNKQLDYILELEKSAPALVEVIIASPNVTWQKGIGRMELGGDVEYVIGQMGDRLPMYSCLPDWTPLPNHSCPDVLPWWISALKISLPKAQSQRTLYKFKRLAHELQVGMLMRWPGCYSPDDNESEYVWSKDQIYHALLELV